MSKERDHAKHAGEHAGSPSEGGQAVAYEALAQTPEGGTLTVLPDGLALTGVLDASGTGVLDEGAVELQLAAAHDPLDGWQPWLADVEAYLKAPGSAPASNSEDADPEVSGAGDGSDESDGGESGGGSPVRPRGPRPVIPGGGMRLVALHRDRARRLLLSAVRWVVLAAVQFTRPAEPSWDVYPPSRDMALPHERALARSYSRGIRTACRSDGTSLVLEGFSPVSSADGYWNGCRFEVHIATATCTSSALRSWFHRSHLSSSELTQSARDADSGWMHAVRAARKNRLAELRVDQEASGREPGLDRRLVVLVVILKSADQASAATSGDCWSAGTDGVLRWCGTSQRFINYGEVEHGGAYAGPSRIFSGLEF